MPKPSKDRLLLETPNAPPNSNQSSKSDWDMAGMQPAWLTGREIQRQRWRNGTQWGVGGKWPDVAKFLRIFGGTFGNPTIIHEGIGTGEHKVEKGGGEVEKQKEKWNEIARDVCEEVDGYTKRLYKAVGATSSNWKSVASKQGKRVAQGTSSGHERA